MMKKQSHSWSKIVVVTASLIALGVFVVGCRATKKYKLRQDTLTYSGLAGLHLGYVPGRADCPADPSNPDAGCIVGYWPLGEKRSDRLGITIRCWQNSKLVYQTIDDPREFTIPRLKPGFYNIFMSGDALDEDYYFNNVEVLPHQATLMPVRPQ